MKRRKFLYNMGFISIVPFFTNPMKNNFSFLKESDITIRIHHFFDIIRDFSSNEEILPNLNYKHSYHKVAARVRTSPELKMKIVVGIDSVCDGCIHLKNGACDDTLNKPGFPMKNDYNNYLDKRILEAINLHENEVKTPKELCIMAESYLNKIYSIYEIKDKADTDKRKEEVIKGLKNYAAKHDIKLGFLTNA